MGSLGFFPPFHSENINIQGTTPQGGQWRNCSLDKLLPRKYFHILIIGSYLANSWTADQFPKSGGYQPTSPDYSHNFQIGSLNISYYRKVQTYMNVERIIQ